MRNLPSFKLENLFSFEQNSLLLSVLSMHEGQKGYIILWYTATRDRREGSYG